MPRTLLLAPLAALLAACPEPPPPPPLGTTAVPIDDLQSELARSLCELAFRCKIADNDLLIAPLAFGDIGRCQRVVTPEADQALIDLVRAVKAGRIDYDANKMGACLARYRSSCGALESGVNRASEIAGLCPEAFAGKLARGAACLRAEECAAGDYCQRGAAGGDCSGVCAPRVPIAGACTDARVCVHADSGGFAQCTFTGAGAVCVEQRIYPQASQVGGPCGGGKVGLVRTSTVCADGLWCNRGTCAAPIALDQPCNDDDDACAGTAVCVPDGASPEARGTCRVVPIRRNAGDLCSEDPPFVACDPTLGLECEQGVCAGGIGDGSQGSTCTRADLALPCNPGLYCGSGAAPTCQPLKPAGAACLQDQECESRGCETQLCREALCLAL